MKINLTIIQAISLSIFLPSCFLAPIIGSGNVISENRELSTISSISIEGQASVKTEMGAVQSVSILTDDNIIHEIETVMENEKLVIRNKNNQFFLPTDGIQITVVLTTQLNDISISGTSQFSWVDANPIRTPDITLQISGTGDMHLSHTGTSMNLSISGSGTVDIHGSSQNATVMISGSGTYDADDYATVSTSMNISGTGSAYIFASGFLDCIISGTGSIYYYGTPAISTVRSGTGSVQPG